MISVINKPIKAITGDTSNTSKWTSAHQPVEFEIQRKDKNVSALKFLPDNVRVRISVDRDDSLVVGDTFNYVCGNLSEFSFSLSISSVTSYLSKTYIYSNIESITNTNDLTSVKAFVNITRRGYNIESHVYIADEKLNFSLVGVVKSKDNVFGRAKVNIQKVISSSLENYNKFTYDVINKQVPDSGGIYQVKFREIYEGYTGDFTTVLPSDNLYYVNGLKQLQEENGYNFGEFVPSLNDSRSSKAKFLSVFSKPTYFNNYPFSLSFVYSDLLLDKQITMNENINGSVNTYALLTGGRGFVNRLMLEGGYASTINEISVYLTSGFASTQSPVTGVGGLFEPDTVVAPYTVSVWTNFQNVYEWQEPFVVNTDSSYDKAKINDFLNAPSV